MKRALSFVPILVAAAISLSGTAAAQRPGAATVHVYKTPTCGCCGKWVAHLEANGFATQVTEMDDLSTVKAKHNIPKEAQSCHTGVVDGYVIEGHVPAADVHRLLKERPAVLGIAVPGMPIGSPGMEVPGQKAQPFRTMSFDKQGQLQVFASHE
jgi:hypothetical protein